VKADRYSWIWLALLCLYGFIHSATYALSNPVYESPDEPGHLEFVNRIASGKSLPNQYDPHQFLAEGHQTPLYYVSAGLLLRATGGPISVSLPVSNTNPPAPYFNHGPNPFKSSRDKAFFYGLRLVGSLLVGLTVLQVGRAARLILPVGHVWLCAPLLVAALPQFAFIGSNISNDGLAAFFGACVVYAVALCKSDPAVRKHWILLGVYVGLAFLSKKNAIVLAPSVLVFLGAWRLYEPSQARPLGRNVLSACAVALLLLLPVLLRNQMLYGELLGNKMETETMPNLVFSQSLHSWHFHYVFPHVVPVSYVAEFGWMSVEVKPFFVWRMVWFIGICGGLSVLALFDRERAAVAIFCWAAFLANVAGLVYYNLLFPQAQGRLLFPTLAAVAMLFAIGLFEVSRHVNSRVKVLAFLPLVVWFVWFDVLCFYTNQNFYAWFGPKLGF